MNKILLTNKRGLFMCIKKTEFDFNTKMPANEIKSNYRPSA